MLCQKLIQDRYKRQLELRTWSALRATNQFLIPNAYTAGSVIATFGSTTLTGTSTAWTSDMVGRQIKLNGQAPIFDIISIDVGAQTLVLNAAWGLPSTSVAGYMILRNYVTTPDDFKRFIVIADPLRQWKLFFNIKSTELNIYDPGRTNVGDPWVVADLSFDSAGIPRYELWPGPQTQRVFPYVYEKQGALLVNDDDEPIYPFRGEEITLGALADLCSWPGTIDNPNPLFAAASTHVPLFEGRCTDAINNLYRQDEEIYLNSWGQNDISNYPFAPFDDKFIQNHAMYQ